MSGGVGAADSPQAWDSACLLLAVLLRVRLFLSSASPLSVSLQQPIVFMTPTSFRIKAQVLLALPAPHCVHQHSGHLAESPRLYPALRPLHTSRPQPAQRGRQELPTSSAAATGIWSWCRRSQAALYLSSFWPLYLTEAQPHPDFLAGLTSFLQCVAQALGELKTCPVSCHTILPSSCRSPVNFLPCGDRVD